MEEKVFLFIFLESAMVVNRMCIFNMQGESKRKMFGWLFWKQLEKMLDYNWDTIIKHGLASHHFIIYVFSDDFSLDFCSALDFKEKVNKVFYQSVPM